MRVAVFGSGYVGLVTGTCLAQVGHQVTCVDVDPDKVARLSHGESPLYEPGLEDSMRQGLREGLLIFGTDSHAALAGADVIFIAVATPTTEDGSADVANVLAVAETLGNELEHDAVVVIKSTVPVGTADQVSATIEAALQRRALDLDIEVASNPEFLKEGAALNDFMRPDRIIVGTESPRVMEVFRHLYAAFNRNHERLMFMDVRSAELTKYAANTMLATKISFINEIANIAERVGADVEAVRKGIGADPRIGFDFIYPGCGYGGSCFPKDVRALAATARKHGYQPQILPAVEAVNRAQKEQLYNKLEACLGEIGDKTIAIWGLSFKPNTDDMRDAPSLQLIQSLLDNGARIRAYDPHAMQVCAALFPDRERLVLAESKEEAAAGAHALVICTEWKSFWSPDFAALRERMLGRLIVDGRNLYEPAYVAGEGFHYVSIGRPEGLNA